jgi:hypothetical protein
MKTVCIALLCSAAAAPFYAQTSAVPDTLIVENFVENNLPSMLPFPTGDDLEWINYDADQLSGRCVEPPDSTPFGWFLEKDFGELNSTNDAFTSCSFLTGSSQNYNWLIVSPLEIPDSTYWLCWRSLPFQGPQYLDGYKVLVSTTSNDPSAGAFTDTIFKAAQMLGDAEIWTLDLDDYQFSDGYIHANGFTDTNYYFFDPDGGPQGIYRGKLEPHMVSLSKYAGKKIYIAFLHDSDNDFMLQVDDIIVSNDNHFVPTHALLSVLYFNVLPNPVRDAAYVSWKMKTPQEGRLVVTDNVGKVVKQQTFSRREEGRVFFEMQDLQPGIYYCTLETSAGRTTMKMVKL